MAVTHVQFLGGVAPSFSAHTTTVLSPSSKTVTGGNIIIVGFESYGDVTPTGVTDNLGNTYARIERTVHSNGVVADLWYAPVTHAGSITTVTISHPSSSYTMLLASEFAGVGTLNAAGGGLTGVSATATWVNNKTIPASGLAVGVGAEADGQHTHTAGAASGSPSTTVYKSGQIDAGADTFTLSLCYALAGASAVTSFAGTAGMGATVSWAGAGALFNESVAMASPVTIQPSTADTTLWGGYEIPQGGSDPLRVLPDPASRRHSLVSFDIAASVPAGATITLAKLSLYASGVYSGRTIGCYRLRRTDWVEAQATWNNYKTSTAWGTAGALNTTTDHDTTDGATSASRSSAGWQDWTVTAQVQYALNNVAGIAHFFLKDTGADSNTAQQSYVSRENATTTNRPKLYIEYTVPSAVQPNFLPFFWA